MARPSRSDQTRKTITLPIKLWHEVGQFRYSAQIPSETEAVRQLIQAGLDARKRMLNELMRPRSVYVIDFLDGPKKMGISDNLESTDGIPATEPKVEPWNYIQARLLWSTITAFGWEVVWRHKKPIPDDAWPIDLTAAALLKARNGMDV